MLSFVWLCIGVSFIVRSSAARRITSEELARFPTAAGSRLPSAYRPSSIPRSPTIISGEDYRNLCIAHDIFAYAFSTGLNHTKELERFLQNEGEVMECKKFTSMSDKGKRRHYQTMFPDRSYPKLAPPTWTSLWLEPDWIEAMYRAPIMRLWRRKIGDHPLYDYDCPINSPGPEWWFLDRVLVPYRLWMDFFEIYVIVIKEGGIWKPFQAFAAFMSYSVTGSIDTWNYLVKEWSTSLEKATEKGTSGIDKAKLYVQQCIINFFKLIQNIILGIFSRIYTFVAGIIGMIWTFIAVVVGGILEFIVATIIATSNTIGTAIVTFYTGVINVIHAIVTSIFNVINGFAFGIEYGIKNTIYLIKAGIFGLISGIKNLVVLVGQGIVAFVAAIFAGIGTLIMGIILAIWSIIMTIFNFTKDIIMTICVTVVNFVWSIFAMISSTISNAVNNITETITATINAVQNFIFQSWQDFLSTLPTQETVEKLIPYLIASGGCLLALYYRFTQRVVIVHEQAIVVVPSQPSPPQPPSPAEGRSPPAAPPFGSDAATTTPRGGQEEKEIPVFEEEIMVEEKEEVVTTTTTTTTTTTAIAHAPAEPGSVTELPHLVREGMVRTTEESSVTRAEVGLSFDVHQASSPRG